MKKGDIVFGRIKDENTLEVLYSESEFEGHLLVLEVLEYVGVVR